MDAPWVRELRKELLGPVYGRLASLDMDVGPLVLTVRDIKSDLANIERRLSSIEQMLGNSDISVRVKKIEEELSLK